MARHGLGLGHNTLMSITYTNTQVNPQNELSQLAGVQQGANLIGLSDCEYVGKSPPSAPAAYKVGRRGAKIALLHKKLSEVRGVEIYASTVITKRFGRVGSGNTERQEILNLSTDSLANLAFIAFNTPAHFPSMMTLTYPAKFSNEGRQIKEHLDNFLRWYKYHYQGHKYLWFLEFQRRGAPHFHLLSTVDLGEYGKLATVRRVKDGKRQTWQTHWETWKEQEQAWKKLGGGLTAWEVINDVEGGKKYAARYATKAHQKAVPPTYRNVGRFWGHSREGVKPDPSGFYECSEAQLREALKRGGWEHLPDDGELIYRELFQAAKAIDLSLLTQVATLERPKVEPARPILPADYPSVRGQVGYLCQICGTICDKWAGQCVSCGEWHTLTLRT